MGSLLEVFNRIEGADDAVLVKAKAPVSAAKISTLLAVDFVLALLGGGKITGAGGGGHLLLYCPFNKRHIVRERLSALGTSVTDFRFDPVGMQTWRVYK